MLRQIESDSRLRFRCADLDARPGRFLNLLLRVLESTFEYPLSAGQCIGQVRRKWRPCLEVSSQLEHLTAIFVVLSSVAPDKANLFRKSIPGFEVSNSGGWGSTVLSLDSFLYASQADRMPNEFIVVFKLP